MANQIGRSSIARQAGSMNETKAHWEEHYGERDRIWSGRVNVQFADVVADLPPGRALDLGCGEGADAVWLAEQGWEVVAVDISETALGRAKKEATSRGIAGRIQFVQLDLSDDFPDGTFDLVSAQFLHSTVRLDRQPILVNAAAALRPGGLLVIVDHGSAPPWASKLDHHHEFPSAEEVVAGLDLSTDEFEHARVEAVERQAVGPEGQQRPWMDNVIVLRRRASA
jgi:SAM-dependent methyltransferase